MRVHGVWKDEENGPRDRREPNSKPAGEGLDDIAFTSARHQARIPSAAEHVAECPLHTVQK